MTTFHKMLAGLGTVLATCIVSNQEIAAQSPGLTAFYTAPVVSMAPMWIAKEVGFFKKQGLDVRLVFIASGPTGTTSLLAGEPTSASSAALLLHARLLVAPRIS